MNIPKTSPNSAWKPGDKLDPPKGAMIQIEPESSSVQKIYKLLIGGVVPRPIAFLSTISNSGVGNLAPFSFFNAVSSNPPCIVISISSKSSGGKKDSLINIEQNGQFVVNSANKWLIEPLVHSAAEYPYGVDEMEKIGLTPQSSIRVKPSRVKESAFQMECEVYKTVEIGDGSPGSSTLVIGRVLLFHILESAYKDERVLIDELMPVGRLGGINYGLVGEQFSIPIPKV